MVYIVVALIKPYTIWRIAKNRIVFVLSHKIATKRQALSILSISEAIHKEKIYFVCHKNQ